MKNAIKESTHLEAVYEFLSANIFNEFIGRPFRWEPFFNKDLQFFAFELFSIAHNTCKKNNLENEMVPSIPDVQENHIDLEYSVFFNEFCVSSAQKMRLTVNNIESDFLNIKWMVGWVEVCENFFLAEGCSFEKFLLLFEIIDESLGFPPINISNRLYTYFRIFNNEGAPYFI